MNIQQFWSDVLAQRADEIREYFHGDAYVNWHCSNEHFTVEEFIRANCDYPGDWDGEVEKVVTTDDMIITATRVYPKDHSASFHVTSFIKLLIGCTEEEINTVYEFHNDSEFMKGILIRRG